MKIIDISKEGFTAARKPTEPEPKIQKLHRLTYGDEYNQSAIYASCQMGTHILTPAYVFGQEDSDDLSTDTIPLAKTIGPVTVLTVPSPVITGEVVENYFPWSAKRLILRTENGEPLSFFAGAAEDIAAIGYQLIGFEGFLGDGATNLSPYRDLMAQGAVLLEGLDLSKVERDGEFFLFAQPVKWDGLEAVPCRALLVADEMNWSSSKSRLF